MQISGGTLPVSVSSLICPFTFECQSESSAKMFHLSGDFRTFAFGVHETADLQNAQLYFFIYTT